MEVSRFLAAIGKGRDSFFTGVPDSLLRALCDYLMEELGISSRHIIAANEGNCAAIAAGHYLATGEVPVVYLQNSGLGNITNPVASLLNEKVYAIPCIFIVGYRGEPGVHDEPQHIFQGEITEKLLETIGIDAFVLRPDTGEEAVRSVMAERFAPLLQQGKSVAFIVAKSALTYEGKVAYQNENTMLREEVIRRITAVSGEDVVVSTTGKASRELFEIREERRQHHGYDLLTVGSMGHCSSIALGIALEKPHTRIWCIDGDGAALMHMGAMAVIGSNAPENLIHVVINNSAHESVGGLPTVAGQVDLPEIARACGYPQVLSAAAYAELDEALAQAKAGNCLTFLEVKCAIGARGDLGRPTATAAENKDAFMAYLEELN